MHALRIPVPGKVIAYGCSRYQHLDLIAPFFRRLDWRSAWALQRVAEGNLLDLPRAY
jgi:hypothetical protein